MAKFFWHDCGTLAKLTENWLNCSLTASEHDVKGSHCTAEYCASNQVLFPPPVNAPYQVSSGLGMLLVWLYTLTKSGDWERFQKGLEEVKKWILGPHSCNMVATFNLTNRGLNLLQKKFLPLTSRRFRRTFKLISKAEVAINELLSDLNFNWD